MISTPDDPQKEFKEFVKWTKRLFDDDPIALHLVFQIYKAINDKQTSLMGVIVESEPDPITDSEIANLALFLTEKGLPTNHKHDNI